MTKSDMSESSNGKPQGGGGWGRLHYRVVDALPKIGKAGLTLYCALLTFADDEGACWPSIPSLMRRAHLGKAAILDATRRLTHAGLLRVEPRLRPDGGATSNWYLLLPLCTF
jgi:hypothetical protein